ncbi:PREDICTED: coiled-coil domain-containing protein 178 [Crocodylus porosus]|uniref:coiled-coil domain-containing protein 178 n=1 Tax=Crocodylus porosus TaxID=8502 RepID=UPI00093EE2EA|nr:PREDICTED: coiled-coil domain-containing protein 178 [Crocodylus porosus]
MFETQSLSCSSKDSSEPPPGKSKEVLLGYPTRRRSCALVNTPSLCVNKVIHLIQELEVKLEKFFQQYDHILKEKILWISKMGKDVQLSSSSPLDVKETAIYCEDSNILTLKRETEAVLSEVIELIKRLEADCKEAEEALKFEKQRKKNLGMKIDCISLWRLQQLPAVVQKEYEACAQDISELQWYFHCKNHQLQQVQNQVLKIKAVNKKIQEDVDFMKKHSPLLEEKLNLEGSAVKDVLKEHGEASEIYNNIYQELTKVQQTYKHICEEAEEERKSMSQKIKYAEMLLNQYESELKRSESLWTEYCMKLKDTEEKIIKDKKHLEELVKQKIVIQEDTKSWNSKVKELNNKIPAQENENNSLFSSCSEVITICEDLRSGWESEVSNMKQTLLNTLQVVNDLECENKGLTRENEVFLQEIRDSSKRKIAYQSEIQAIRKNIQKTEEQIRKVNKELYNIEMSYAERKLKLEGLEEKIIQEKVQYKNLEDNLKCVIRSERGAWQTTQVKIKTMSAELEEKQRESMKNKEAALKRIADIVEPLADLEAKLKKSKNTYKENNKKLSNLNRRIQDLDEQQKQIEQQLEHRKTIVQKQLSDTQGKYSDVSTQLDETIHNIENFQNRILELNGLWDLKQRQMETTEKSLTELRENLNVVKFKQQTAQMITDHLQDELEKYEKRIKYEEKIYGELLWIRQKDLEDLRVALEQTLKENFCLAQEYQNFQNYYLNDKGNLMDLYDNKVKVEAAVRDHEELSVLQSRMHRALVEYFKQRGLYSQAGLAKFQAASHENAQKILAVQGELSKTIQHIAAFLHSLTDGSSSKDGSANNRCILDAEIKDKKSHTVQITV